MDDRYRHMLSNNASIPPEKLLAYLEGKLGDPERMEVEMAMVESDFLADASEGLEHMQEPARIPGIVDELNLRLRQHARGRQHRSIPTPAGFPGWLAFAAILLILLTIAGYIVLRLTVKG